MRPATGYFTADEGGLWEVLVRGSERDQITRFHAAAWKTNLVSLGETVEASAKDRVSERDMTMIIMEEVQLIAPVLLFTSPIGTASRAGIAPAEVLRGRS